MSVRAKQSKCENALMLAASAVAMLAFWMLPAFTAVVTHAAQARAAKSITVNGVVHNAGGEPVSGADVYLADEKNSVCARSVSASDGSFKLTVDHGGTYTVRAEKSGWTGDQSDPIELPRDANKRVELVMENARGQVADSEGKTAANPAAGKTATAANGTNTASGTTGIEFSDEPNFTVAGVTDRSNLGLHGSDTTARTSDTLARETARLKGQDAEKMAHADALATQKYQSAVDLETKGDLSGARAVTQKALASGDDSEGHHLLGDLDEKMNDPLGAVREYERAARMYPSEQNYFDWGSELLLHKAAQPALEVFSKGAGLHPQSARMLAGRGAAQYGVRSYEDAARSLCQASDLKPGDSALYLFLGQMEKTVNVPLPCAEEKLAAFAAQQPANAAANYFYAISLMKREKEARSGGDPRAAQTLLEKAVRLDPKYGAAYIELGALAFQRGDFAQAIKDYQQAIAVGPQLSEAHYRLSLAYKRSGDDAAAKREMETYQSAEKAESAQAEKQNRDLKQFLVILKNSPGSTK
ncbi:MAG TPA: tetratricopeptide repeat protein [Candidatus Sulfotelmatobacter sp.]|nr:tetratricopeptide repeat protein [Candidatus Sulfotelmatobacter sp.]